MLTIHELLEDKTYREFFTTPPAMPTLYRERELLPWRFYLQREVDGSWAKRDLPSYGEAFKMFKRWRPQMHDAAIVSRPVAFPPPHRWVRVKGKYREDKHGNLTQVTKLVVWRPQLPPEETDHRWCPYCRRPTVFRWFNTHHAFGKGAILSLVDGGKSMPTRCTICGVRLEGLPRLIPEGRWK